MVSRGVFLYSVVLSPLDPSKLFTLHSGHSLADLSIHLCLIIAQSLFIQIFPPLYIARYSNIIHMRKMEHYGEKELA